MKLGLPDPLCPFCTKHNSIESKLTILLGSQDLDGQPATYWCRTCGVQYHIEICGYVGKMIKSEIVGND